MNIRKKFALLLFIFSCPLFSIGQTLLIFRFTKDRATVVADTRVVSTRLVGFKPNLVKKISYDTLTKIGGSNGIYYGIAGIGIELGVKVASSVCKKAKNVANAAELFRKEMHQNMVHIVQEILDQDPALLSFYMNQPNILQIVFFSFQNGKMKVYTTGFGFSANKAGWGAGAIPVDSTVVYPMGHKSGIIDSVYSPKIWGQKDPIEVSTYLVKKQIKATPQTVAFPLDVLDLTRKRLKRYKIFSSTRR